MPEMICNLHFASVILELQFLLHSNFFCLIFTALLDFDLMLGSFLFFTSVSPLHFIFDACVVWCMHKTSASM